LGQLGVEVTTVIEAGQSVFVRLLLELYQQRRLFLIGFAERGGEQRKFAVRPGEFDIFKSVQLPLPLDLFKLEADT